LSEVFATGASLTLLDHFSPELRKIIAGLEGFDKSVQTSQAELRKLGFGDLAVREGKKLDALVGMTGVVVDKMTAHFDRLGLGADKAFDAVKAASAGAFTAMKTESGEAIAATVTDMGNLSKVATADFDAVKLAASGAFGQLDADAKAAVSGALTALGDLSKGATTEFDAVKAASAGLWTGLSDAASASVDAALGSIGRLDAALEAATLRMKGMADEAAAASVRAAGVAPVSGVGQAVVTGGGASLRTRTMAAHDQNNAAHGGFHFRPHGMAIPGAHLGMSQGGGGMAPLVGGLVIGELLKKGVEAGFDFKHWASGMNGAGFSDAQVGEATQAAWANAGANPNASATDSLKNILELNKATGDLAESMKLLGAFSTAEMGMQSVKAEGLHSKFNGGTQVLNLARSLEELGVTQMGKTPEEREANVKRYTTEAIRTMIASRGLFDGNALFALTNNSGGAAQNWDMRMATVVAPIMGDIMKHSKMGNADYMALKSYAGGHIASDAVQGLMKYGLTDKDDTFQDPKGSWHLKANSHFAEGMMANVYDWSAGKLDRLREHGFDPSNQKQMAEMVNEIGSNKSTGAMMRMVFEPLTRLQLQKEMDLRDKVPTDAAGILQNTDPVLKMDALHKKTEDFLTALGGPLVDPAIAVLTKLTSGINAFAQAMEAHPDLTKVGAMGAGVAALGLTGYGAARMLGFGGGGAALSGAATALDASALALKEAAAALSGRGVGGLSGGGVGGQSPGYASLIGGTIPLALMLYKLAEGMPGELKRAETDNKPVDPSLAHDAVMGDAIRHYWKDHNPFDMGAHAAEGAPIPGLKPSGVIGQASTAIAGRLGLPAGIDMSGAIERATAGLGLLQKQEELNVWQFGQLTTSTGIVKASFDGLNGGSSALNENFAGLGTGSSGLRSALDILTQTAMGAARALASVALSGGVGGGGFGGGGGGFTNASYGGGGGGFGGGGGGPINPGTHGWWTTDHQSHAVDVLMKGGVSELGAKALVSRWMNVEASGGPSTVNGIGASGIGQWLGARKAGLPGDFDGQLRHALGELHGSENRALGYLNSGSALGAATGASQFERAEGYNSRTGMDNFTARTLRGMSAVSGSVSAGRPAATVSAPPPRKVSPGAPASGNMTTAMNDTRPQQHHIYLDGKKIAQVVTKHQATAMRFPNSMGGPDPHGHYTSPGTPLSDVA